MRVPKDPFAMSPLAGRLAAGLASRRSGLDRLSLPRLRARAAAAIRGGSHGVKLKTVPYETYLVPYFPPAAVVP